MGIANGKGDKSLTIDLTNKTWEKFFQEAKKANNLKAIERLDLSRQELTELPPQISKIVNLKILNVYDNQLKTLPSEIGKFPDENFKYYH
jgi:Leucine-rich repeat (LRR) protein